MNKKETLKAVIYIFIGVIIALLIFMFSGMGENRNKKASTSDNTNISSSTNKTTIDENSISQIEKVIGPNFMEIKTGETDRMSIYKKADITGDSIDEALISLGSGGAYTTYFALVQIDTKNNNEIKRAKFKTAEGKIDDVMFVEGASVSHGLSVEFAPSKKAIYSERWQVDPINPEKVSCEIEAYVWNSNSGLFEYNAKVGQDATDNYCSKIFIPRD